MKTIVSLFLSLLLIGFTVAQTAPSKPAPEMEKLLKLWTGHWTTVEIFEPSEDMPKGKQDNGAETMHPGPGGLSLIGDYESHGAPFGHMVVTWLPQEKVYKSYWTDMTQPGVSISTGKWQGDQLVFTSMDESAGKKILSRDTYSNITPTSFTDTLESGPLGGPVKKVLTVKYTKQNNAAVQDDSCDAALTQKDLNDCYGKEFQRADAHLNTIYGKLTASMETEIVDSRKSGDADSIRYGERQIQKLKTVELAWINYRDLQCDAATYEYDGGSMRSMIHSICMTGVTNHRIKEMKDAYEVGDKKLE